MDYFLIRSGPGSGVGVLVFAFDRFAPAMQYRHRPTRTFLFHLIVTFTIVCEAPVAVLLMGVKGVPARVCMYIRQKDDERAAAGTIIRATAKAAATRSIERRPRRHRPTIPMTEGRAAWGNVAAHGMRAARHRGVGGVTPLKRGILPPPPREEAY